MLIFWQSIIFFNNLVLIQWGTATNTMKRKNAELLFPKFESDTKNRLQFQHQPYQLSWKREYIYLQESFRLYIRG